MADIPDPNDFSPNTDRAYAEMLKLFDEISFAERMKRTFRGINMPKDSGEYKFARLQIQRMSAPACAIVGTILVIGLLFAFAAENNEKNRVIETTIIEAQADDKLEEEPPPPEDQVIEDPTEVEVDVNVNVNMPDVNNNVAEAGPVSPKPAAFNSVALNKSPITMKGIYGSRSPGARGKALAGGGGSKATEDCVMRALRWFAWNQDRSWRNGSWEPVTGDGSWGKNKTAMTGLVLLCYLAHGETPASEEFGRTVERGLRFLTDTQQKDGYFRYKDGNNYSHSMATYALCEAYTMTKNPILKEVAEKAVDRIVKGQHPNGGWDYKYAQTDRDDGSFGGWAAQAIKAAKMCGDLEVPGLDEAYERAPKCFMTKLYHKEGGFGYTGPQQGGLTAVGVLCCQLMGHANSTQVKKSLELMDTWEVGFDVDDYSVPKAQDCTQYYFYYATQAMFHSGGTRWDRWNNRMKPRYIKAQQIIEANESGYVDHKGKPRAIGWWVNHDVHSDDQNKDPALRMPINDTAYVTLQLEVYYRHLPTFKTPELVDEPTTLDNSDDVGVNIVL